MLKEVKLKQNLVDDVWNNNLSNIRTVVSSVKKRYGHVVDDIPTIAHSLFYEKFEKYYEEDDDKYMRFFNVCLRNTVKNCVQAHNSWSSRFVSDSSAILTELSDREKACTLGLHNDNPIMIWDQMGDNKKPTPEEEQNVKDIYQYMEEVLTEYDFFVFEHLIEGWCMADIATFLEDSQKEVRLARDRVRNALRSVIM